MGAIVVLKGVADRCVVFYRGPAIYIYVQAAKYAHVVILPVHGPTAVAPIVYHNARVFLAESSSNLVAFTGTIYHPHLGIYIIPQMNFIFFPCLDEKLQQEIC